MIKDDYVPKRKTCGMRDYEFYEEIDKRMGLNKYYILDWIGGEQWKK